MEPKFYVASRASIPERAAMWRSLRDSGVAVVSTWIDEAGEGETESLGELWERIGQEIATSDALILYAEPDDLPLKGALLEVGMALMARKHVYAVLPGIELELRSMRPIGSWLYHPFVSRCPTVRDAVTSAGLSLRGATPPEAAGRGWIDCKQELPSDLFNVLVWIPNQTPRGGYWQLASYGEWFWEDEDCHPGDPNYVEDNDDGNRRGYGWHREEETHGGEYDYVTVDLNTRVTHWQPLPAPPSGEQPQPAAVDEELYDCSFTESGEHAPSPMGDCIYCGSKGRPHKMRTDAVDETETVAPGPQEGRERGGQDA